MACVCMSAIGIQRDVENQHVSNVQRVYLDKAGMSASSKFCLGTH